MFYVSQKCVDPRDPTTTHAKAKGVFLDKVFTEAQLESNVFTVQMNPGAATVDSDNAPSIQDVDVFLMMMIHVLESYILMGECAMT